MNIRYIFGVFVLILYISFFSCSEESTTENEINPSTSRSAKIVYLNNESVSGSRTRKLILKNFDGSDSLELTDEASFSVCPKFSPDGNYIYYTKENGYLYKYNVKTKEHTVIFTSAPYCENIIVSPNGSYILYYSNSAWALINTDGTGIKYVYSGYSEQLKFMPGGNSLCSVDDDRITFRNMDGTEINSIQIPVGNNLPIWLIGVSPNGQQICYLNDQQFRLEAINMDGSSHIVLATIYEPVPGIIIYPSTHFAFSPNGTNVVYVKTIQHDFFKALYIVGNNGSGNTKLTTTDARYNHPVYSKNGSKIFFHSNLDGDYDIYSINTDGSGINNITQDAFDTGYHSHGGFDIWEP